jgi:hypothetical protein
MTAALPLLLGAAACTDVPVAETLAETAKPGAPVKAAPVVRLTNASFLPAVKAAGVKPKSWSGVLRMTSNGQVTTATMAQTYKPLALKMDLSSPEFGGAAHAILINGMFYLGIPDPKLHGKYLRVNLRTSKEPGLVMLGEMVDSSDPVKTFQLWGKGLRKVKFVKSETIGFRKVDRYDVTVTTSAALGLSPGKVPAGLPKTVTSSVWLGADRLMYKMSSKVAGSESQLTITGYDTGVTITAPPANMIAKPR